MECDYLSDKAKEVIADWFSKPEYDASNMYHLEDRVAKHAGLRDPVFLEVVQFIDARNLGNEKYWRRDQWMETVRKLDELACELNEHVAAIDRDEQRWA